jgi:iron-sulfur cluster assembly protein
MAVTLTQAAARHVTRYLSKRGKGVGVRLGVKTTGCSGLAYKLEYVDDVAPEDIVFENHGVKLLVDPKSLAYIDGTELDFVREGLNEGFRFNNPKTGHATFGIGVGSIVLLINVVLIGGYTLGCHSFRRLVGGIMDTMSRSPARKKTYDCVSCLNRHHPKWAWFSLVFVGFTDVYVRLCSMGVISDLRIL